MRRRRKKKKEEEEKKEEEGEDGNVAEKLIRRIDIFKIETGRTDYYGN
jgi:hypothetical protein